MELKITDITKSRYRGTVKDLIVIKKDGEYIDKVVLQDNVYKTKQILKYQVYSKNRFADIYNITRQALDYVLPHNKLNHVIIDNEVFIVIDELAAAYIPNKSKKRGSIGGKIERT